VPHLSGRAAERAAELGVVEMHLSLSFTHSTAVASAVAITQEARPRKDEKPDPMAQLAADFKEARALLDQVGSEGTDSE
jgi:holo-[acyl-carrier protein] synthase